MGVEACKTHGTALEGQGGNEHCRIKRGIVRHHRYLYNLSRLYNQCQSESLNRIHYRNHDSLFEHASPIVRSNVCAASTTRETVHWPRLPDNRPIHPCHCVPKIAAWHWLRRTEERRRSHDTVPWRTRKSWAVVWPGSWCAVPLTTCTARLWRIPITLWPTTRRSAGFRKS